MQASWHVSKDEAFVCEAEDLERLTKLFKSRVGEVSWEIVCADGIDRSGEDLTALLEFDNAPNRTIQRLRLRAWGNNAQCSASVRLGGLFNALDASIDGPIEFVEQLRPALESQLYGLRAWYARVARMDFVGLLLLFWVCTGIVLAIAFDPVDSSNESSGLTARGELLLFSTATLGVMVIGWRLKQDSQTTISTRHVRDWPGETTPRKLRKNSVGCDYRVWSIVIGGSIAAGLTVSLPNTALHQKSAGATVRGCS